MFDKILVVCHGNICRSPLAEAMLKAALPHCRVESAGLHALVGHPADASTQDVATPDGLVLQDHKGRQLNSEMLNDADLILVMSQNQRTAIGEKLPAALGKTMLLGHWLPKQQEIPDPHGKSREVFQLVHEQIRQATTAWAQKLQKTGR